MAERPGPVTDLDWEPARARAFVDEVAGLYEEVLGSLRSSPVIHDRGADDVRAGVVVDIPDAPMPQAELVEYLRRMTFEYSAFPGHPRFYAYVSGAGTVPGAAAELLASGVNMNAGGWRLGPSATEIEMALTRWFANEMFGMPGGSGGALTSGGALANLIALKIARDARAGWDIRADGVAAGPPLGFYLSTETHVVSDRAADTLGVGAGNVRHVSVDERLPHAGRRAAGGDRERSRGRRAAHRGRRERGNRLDRRGRRPRLDRGRLSRRGRLDARRRRLRRPGDAGRRSAPALRGHRASGLDRLRSPQVAVHTAAGRLRPRAGHGCDAPRVRPRVRLVHRQGRRAHRLGHRPRPILPELQPGVLGAQGVGFAAGARPGRLRPPDLPRRGARSLPRRARRGARSVRAHDTRRALDHVLPLRAAGSRPVGGSGGVPRPS